MRECARQCICIHAAHGLIYKTVSIKAFYGQLFLSSRLLIYSTMNRSSVSIVCFMELPCNKHMHSFRSRKCEAHMHENSLIRQQSGQNFARKASSGYTILELGGHFCHDKKHNSYTSNICSNLCTSAMIFSSHKFTEAFV